jgi:hypothetical protein
MNSDNFDIIVSRYNENLEWTLEEPFCNYKYIVYNKGENEDFEKSNVKTIIKIPNVGRCDHTYLYHIVNNYESLNNILVFISGSVNMQNKKKKAAELLNRIKNNNHNSAIFVGHIDAGGILKSFYNFSLDEWVSSDVKNYQKNKEKKLTLSEIRPFGKWFLHNFGDLDVKYYNYHGIFSVDKRDVIKHRKFRYEKLLNQLSVSSNPEVGHYIERSWGAIFYPLIYTKIFINPV